MNTTLPIVFCIPRPDKLSGEVSIGSAVKVVDIFAEADSCSFELADGESPSGAARFDGLCDHGANPAGYSLSLDGDVVLRRECATSTDLVAVRLAGTVAVQAREL